MKKFSGIQFKRLVGLLLAAVVTAGLAACGGGSADSSSASESGKSESGSKPESTQTDSSSAGSVDASKEDGDDPVPVSNGEWEPIHDYSERLDLVVSNVGTIEGYNYTDGDAYVKYYSDKFNYNLDVIGTTYDNWNERMRVWINSGDMPEISVINYTSGTHNDFVNYVDQGLLKLLPDDWKTTWPNVAKAFDVSSLGPHSEEMFDGTYFLPRPRFGETDPSDPIPDHLSFYFRRDWAEAVGFEVKTSYTITEIFEYLRLVKEQDPGELGSGLKVLVGNPAYTTRMFVQMNSAHYTTFFRDTDDAVKWGPASDDTLVGLKLFKEAYDEGLLDPEFYNYKIDEDIELVTIQGIAAGCFQPAPSGSTINTWRQRYVDGTGGDYEDIAVATVLGEDGNYHQEDLINFWGVIAFSPDIDDAKFERWMDMLDYNATTEGIANHAMGLPGVDWSVDDNGEYTSYLPEGQLLTGATGKYPGNHSNNIPGMFDDFLFNDPRTPLVSRELSRTLYAERNEKSTPETFPLVDWDFYTYSSPAYSKVAFDYGVEYSSLVTMDGDIEDNWKSWVDSKMSIVQPVIDEMEEALS